MPAHILFLTIHLPSFEQLTAAPRRRNATLSRHHEDARIVGSFLIGLLATAASTAQSRAVQVGYCTPLRNLEAAKSAGFDYVELSTTEIAGLSDADFEQAAARDPAGRPARPGDEPVSAGHAQGDRAHIDREQQMAYVKKAFARLARLGTQIVVFGSGGARQVPDGFPKDEAFRQLVEFGRRIAPEARPRGITVAIEPLRRAGNQHHQLGGRGADAGQRDRRSRLSIDGRLLSSRE